MYQKVTKKSRSIEYRHDDDESGGVQQYKFLPARSRILRPLNWTVTLVSDPLDVGETVSFDFSKSEETWDVFKGHSYKLEVWGAQGWGGTYNGTTKVGGYGSYSIGTFTPSSDLTLYINVGGTGAASQNSTSAGVDGSYNGGGGARSRGNTYTLCSGGGATHIATASGLLATLSENKSAVLIVAGGGGGSGFYGTAGSAGAHAGGIQGNSQSYGPSTGGTQTGGGTGRTGNGGFGYGANGNHSGYGCGGGGGWYGGGADAFEWGGSGGSGYIGNSLLTDKYMVGYSVTTSTAADTYTKSVTKVSATATADTPKTGNGFARITRLS